METLIGIVVVGKAIVIEEAAAAAIRLGGTQAARRLVSLRKATVARRVATELSRLESSILADDDLVSELVDSLLDDNVLVRESAARLLSTVLPPELGAELLRLYQQSGTYYYNVIGIIDRGCLSPEPFVSAFKASSKRWLEQDIG